MKIKFILTACIVNLGITLVYPHSQKRDQAAVDGTNDESKVGENVRNLFDSIVKNNAKESQLYREILQKGVTEEQQAFNAIKEETQIARMKNSYARRRQSFLKKRETNEKTLTCEDEFVKHFGNPEYLPWVKGLKWFENDERWKMNMICNDAYKMKHLKESYYIEDVNFMENITLTFTNPKYRPMITDVLEFKSRRDERYGGVPNKDDHRPIVETWILTQGRKEDCVHYVRPMTEMRQVKLVEEVCGLEWF